MYAEASKEIYGSVNIKDKCCKILLFFGIIDIIYLKMKRRDVMKKIICSFLLFIFIFNIVGSVNAYSTSQYSIDIPSTYRKATEGSFTKENGNNVNVQVVPFSGSSSNAFTEEGLNKLTKNINSEIDNVRTKMKKTIKERYGEYLSDNEIDEYVKSFKCDSIDKKEITTATKNNYKCYHIIASYSAGDYKYYVEQYSFISNNNVYTLTASVGEKSDLQSLEVRNIINSFTISNYKNPEKSSFFSDKLLSKMIAAGIVALICGGIKAISDKNKRNKAEQENDTLKEDAQNEIDKKEEQEINKIVESIENDKKENTQNNNEDIITGKDSADKEGNKKYCTKCGAEINEDWDFCNNCGNKLK